MSQALEQSRKRSIRLPVGLLLSIGAEKPERGPGRAIDHIRPKEGQLQQYAAEAARFTEVYGAEPKELNDLYFLANEVPAVLDVRLLAFSQSGIRGVGDTNYAEITDESEFEERVFGARAFEDGFTFFPKDVSEIRPELKKSWEGEPVYGELTGRSDARVEKLQIKYVTSLEFCLPEIMGLGKVARISTSGRASTRNLYKALWTEWGAFGGQLEGIPFRLSLRPRSTQRFEAKDKKYVQTTVYELVLDTPHTVAELRKAIEDHRRAFGLPSREQLRLEGRALSQALALPLAEGEEQTREEVVAEVPDWLLNKIAHLEAEIAEDARRAMLLGVFGVEQSTDLQHEQAERYWKMLEAVVPAEEVEGEVVNGDEGLSEEGGVNERSSGLDGSTDVASESRSASDDLSSTSPPAERPSDHQDSAEAHLTADASNRLVTESDASTSAEQDSDAASPPAAVAASEHDSAGDPSDGRAASSAVEAVAETATTEDQAELAVSSPADDVPLPGEPMGDGYHDPLEDAGAMEIPIGGNRGTKIADLKDDYIVWALNNGRYFGEYAEFYSGLEFFVQQRKPLLWEQVRG